MAGLLPLLIAVVAAVKISTKIKEITNLISDGFDDWNWFRAVSVCANF